MSTSNLPSSGENLAQSAPDIALIERLANELFSAMPGGISAASASSPAGSASPRLNDLALPLSGSDPLDLHLDTAPSGSWNTPPASALGIGLDTGLNSGLDKGLDNGLPGESLLRDLLKDHEREHPKATGATLYFLDEAARFQQDNPAYAGTDTIARPEHAGQSQYTGQQASAHPP
ncbi:MAG: hypothetical protein LBG66_04865, partial [Gallionellaceae bacterium]|nr:hypothetical protein [Gallionellaceae bacterium]